MSSTGSRPSAFETVRPVVVLVAICMLAGALLGVVHYVTDPVAQANAEQKAQETYAQLVPQAASFEPVDCTVEGCTAALEARDASGAVIAHVIVAQSKGYGGQVPIAVAFGTDGTVTSITTMSPTIPTSGSTWASLPSPSPPMTSTSSAAPRSRRRRRSRHSTSQLRHTRRCADG